jgi:protein-tyrosine phosphatase
VKYLIDPGIIISVGALAKMERKILPIQNSYWVIPGRFRAGEHPAIGSVDGTRLKIRWLLSQGINIILDLTEMGEADINYPTYIHNESISFDKPVSYQRIPIQDWSTPSRKKMIEILETIEEHLRLGKNIYLHCYGGLGRTGLAVGCYLGNQGMPGDQALAKILELRNQIPGEPKKSPETEKQKRMVLEWTKES